MTYGQDTKQHLSELINLYTEQLEKPVATLFGDLIQQERKECIHQLDELRLMDMEATLWAKSGSTKAKFSL